MFFFFFFEQDIVNLIRQSLSDNETLEAGSIKDTYAYDYYLPNGCRNLDLPEKTAIEIKKNLAPGLLSILISDAHKAYETGDFNHFLVIYKEGRVYQDWIPDEIKSFVSFMSKDEVESQVFSNEIGEKQDDWKSDRELRIKKLRNEIRKGQNSLFIGAGLSCSLGVPKWQQLLKNLHIRIRKKVDNYPKYKAIKNDSKGSYLITARYLSDVSDKKKLTFISDIRKQLYNKPNLKSKFLDAVINMLKQNWIGEIITYNYDTLLEQRMTNEEIMNTSVDGRNRRVKNAIPVMHVHGVIDSKDNTFDNNVVLSEDEYHKLYRDSFHWANVAQLYALTHTTCIFIGLSMADPSLRRLLDIAYQQGSQDVEHYAFLIRPEFECHKETEAVFSQMGVSVIWCEDENDVPRQIERLI